jgi:hypothetical protein
MYGGQMFALPRLSHGQRLALDPSDIVKILTAHLKGTSRNLTTDNWYTGYPLAVSLMKDKITSLDSKEKQTRNYL